MVRSRSPVQFRSSALKKQFSLWDILFPMSGQFDTFINPKDRHWSTREGIRATGVKRELRSRIEAAARALDDAVVERQQLELRELDDKTKGRERKRLDDRVRTLEESLIRIEIPEMVEKWAEDTFANIRHEIEKTYYNNRENQGLINAHLEFLSKQSIASVLLRKALLALAQTVDFRIRYARDEHGRTVSREGFGGLRYSEEQRKMLLDRMGSIALDPATLKDAIVGYYTHPHPSIENPFEYKKGQRLPPQRLISRLLADERIREQIIATQIELHEKNSLDMPRDILNEHMQEGIPERSWNVYGKKYKLLELTTAAQLAQVGKLADNCIITFADQLVPQQKGKNKGKPPTRFFAFCEIYDEPRTFKDALEGSKSSRMNQVDEKFKTQYRPHIVMEYQANTRSVGQVRCFQNTALDKSDLTIPSFLQSLDFLRRLDGMETRNWGDEFLSLAARDHSEYVTLEGVKKIGGTAEGDEEIIAFPREGTWDFDVPGDVDEKTAKFWLGKKPGRVDISAVMDRPEILGLITEVGGVRSKITSESLSDAPTFDDFVVPNLRFAAYFKIWINCSRLVLPSFEGFNSVFASSEFHTNGPKWARYSRIDEVIAPRFSAGRPDEGPSSIHMNGIRLFECAHIGDNCSLIIQLPDKNYPGLTIICPNPITKNISLGAAHFTNTREKYDTKNKYWVYPGVKGLRRFATRADYETWLAKQEKK